MKIGSLATTPVDGCSTFGLHAARAHLVAGHGGRGLGLTYAFSRGISRRLDAMVQNAERLAEGEGPLPVLGGEDEIGRVRSARSRPLAAG